MPSSGWRNNRYCSSSIFVTLSGQAGALRQAVANALQNFDPELRPPLKISMQLSFGDLIIVSWITHQRHENCGEKETWSSWCKKKVPMGQKIEVFCLYFNYKYNWENVQTQ